MNYFVLVALGIVLPSVPVLSLAVAFFHAHSQIGTGDGGVSGQHQAPPSETGNICTLLRHVNQPSANCNRHNATLSQLLRDAKGAGGKWRPSLNSNKDPRFRWPIAFTMDLCDHDKSLLRLRKTNDSVRHAKLCETSFLFISRIINLHPKHTDERSTNVQAWHLQSLQIQLWV